MGLNGKLFSETTGRMRLVSIVFAVIAFILVVDHYIKNYSNEEAYFYTIMICMIVSIIMAVISIIGLMDNSNIRMLDNVFHAVAGLAVIITAIIFLVSVFENKRGFTNSQFARRLASGIIGFIYGLICANTSWFLFRANLTSSSLAAV